MNIDDIVSLSEAAQRLNIKENTMRRWQERSASTKFPQPIKVLNPGGSRKFYLYNLNDIQEWLYLWKATRG